MVARIELSPDELNSLNRGEALRLPANDSRQVVLLSSDHYDRLKHALDLDANPLDLYPGIADISPEDWDDLANYPHAEKL